jgi:putative FmdB family regulatory protein
MPIFEFKCTKCKTVFEEFVFSASTDTSKLVCPECGEKNAEKLMSAFSSSFGSTLRSGGASCGSSGFG